MTQTLYSLRTDGDQYRITKIVDGEIESSYLSTERECECPAGHRPSCRHRQMIPEMLARGLCDSMWFWNFDTHRVVDFNGELKSNLDALNELADRAIGATTEDFEREHGITAVAEGPPSEVARIDMPSKPDIVHADGTMIDYKLSKPWRRM